ncbi:4-hydroxy-2-oxoglutarate aldolase, mitochondrial [Branchiostoma belcheri]|nr:4-hydroxy-2-oxoglutarate aldolase, mitochondrial [Branchiostoma belcheri]
MAFVVNNLRPLCKLGALTVHQPAFGMGGVRVLACVHRGMASFKKIDLSGVFPPLPTPFNQDETINYEHLRNNVTKWNEIGFKGYVVQGSNGEYTYLSDTERVELVRTVKQAAAPGKLIIAGSGCESTQATIDMTRKMAEAGADVVMVITPFYFKGRMTSQAFKTHYEKVASASPVPVILYSVPANTGVDLPADVVVQLSQHPNIIGIKDSAGDVTKFGSMVQHTQASGFQVLAGSASFMLGTYTVGAVGCVAALANTLGKEVCQLHNLFKEGKMEEAMKLQHRLIAPNSAVTRKFGVPGLKVAMDWFGYYGGPTRLPLLPLSPEEVESMKADFQNNGFL